MNTLSRALCLSCCLAGALVAHADIPTESYTYERWSTPYVRVEVLCHVVVSNEASHNWGFALPDPKTGSVPTDVVTLDPDRMAQRFEELGMGDAKAEGEPWEARSVIYGPLVCQTYTSYLFAEVECDNQCRCTGTCGSDGGWVCSSADPQALAQFSRSSSSGAVLVELEDRTCGTTPEPDPDPHP
jgi:hypothetical protein